MTTKEKINLLFYKSNAHLRLNQQRDRQNDIRIDGKVKFQLSILNSSQDFFIMFLTVGRIDQSTDILTTRRTDRKTNGHFKSYGRFANKR